MSSTQTDKTREERDKLVLANLPLAARVAKTMHRKCNLYGREDDLKSEAMLLLVIATQSFDTKKSENFEAYAACKICYGLIDYMRTSRFRLLPVRKKNRDPIDVLSLDFRDTAAQDILEFNETHFVYGYKPPTAKEISDAYTNELEARQLLNTVELQKAKTALTLHFLEDIKLKDVGKRMGFKESRASQLCIRGIKEIREKAGIEVPAA